VTFLRTLDYPLAIQRSRLAWECVLDGAPVPDGRLLAAALMHHSSHDAFLLLPHRRPESDDV
jgi:hypothetical protein